MTRRIALLLACTAAAPAAAGCGATFHGRGLRVVATTTQLGDFVRQVGGDRVALVTILHPNTDPHEYEPRPRDVEAVAKAKVLFESGAGLDAWMGKVVARSGGHPRVVELWGAIPVRRGGDPHWWHNPVNAEAAVGAIRDALTRADPSGRAAYAAAAARYVARLRRLDAAIRACMARIPPAQRVLVTDHDAFGYFAARYGIRIAGAVFPSQTTQAQASARGVSRLVALIRREHVRAVFPETSLNASLARAIASQSGASSRYELYGDTLGPAGSPGATYAGMERANADAIARGLTGGRVRCGRYGG
ncbi:MAG TPA: zinc ABC transporter substrate-binding protein [Solirubrobacteraceae bacterium]|nr:zinc ABC transporter substrate-binding protein [Solirubrobacteraceae bacterium]